MFKNKLQLIIFLMLPFVLAFPLHFIYDYISFPILAIYTPINESIFEHTKLTFTPIIITYLILFLINKKLNKKQLLSSLIISILSSLTIMLILYYLSLSIIGKDMVLASISCLLIATTLGQLLGIYIYKKEITWSINLSVYILITMTFALLIMTTNPPHSEFFIDKS